MKNSIKKFKNTRIVDKSTILKAIEENNSTEPLINTGSRNIDNILDGGFKPGNTYMIYGPNSSGKTQFCHQLCIQAYIRNIQSIYLDTENTFRPERIRELATTHNLNIEKILKMILVSNIMSSNVLEMKLNETVALLRNGKIRLLILDSINNYFRLERGEKDISFYKAKSSFIRILNKLSDITFKYKIVTIVTAQVTSNFFEDAEIRHIPVGFQYLSHFFSEMFYLTPKMEDMWYIHLINSHSLSEKRVPFKITKKGIEDYKL